MYYNYMAVFRHIYLLILSISHMGSPQPQVRVNSTTVIGRSIRILSAIDQEFFGGAVPSPYPLRTCVYVSQGFLTLTLADSNRLCPGF